MGQNSAGQSGYSTSKGCISSEVQQLKDFAAKPEELCTTAISGTSEIHGDGLIDSPGAGGDDEDPITHVELLHQCRG